MKILQVGSSMPTDWGGIERYIAFLAPALAARGHQVTVTAPEGSPLLKRAGVPVVPIHVRTKYDFGAVAAYLKYFRRESFDIVNVHFSPDYWAPAVAARMTRQKNVVLTRHLAIGWGQQRVRQISRLYSHIISVSEAVRRELLTNCNFDADFITTAYAGVPELVPTKDRDEACLEFGMASGLTHVGVFGRLTLEKGHAPLIKIVGQTTGIHLHIFGEGPEKENLQRLAQNERVTFHGYINDVNNAMNAVDIIAIPSLWAEAFSIAALEACSLGKPIVASPRGGLPELISDEDTGILADPENESGRFSKSLERLSTNPEFREKLGLAAKNRHATEFTTARFAERIEAVYAKVIDPD